MTLIFWHWWLGHLLRGLKKLLRAGIAAALSLLSLVPSPSLAEAITALYGETHEPEQIGSGYLVFHQEGDLVVGAVYYPRSSYDCIYGQRQGQKLRVNSIAAYSGEIVELEINLEDLFLIPTIPANDRRILEACKEIVQRATQGS